LCRLGDGFGKMVPIAGGQEGTKLIEGLISFLLVSLSLCMIGVCLLVLLGFLKSMRMSTKEE
jgi:hydroxylaminobenzene mutase